MAWDARKRWVPSVARMRKPSSCRMREASRRTSFLSPSLTETKRVPVGGEGGAGAHLGFQEGAGEGAVPAHDLAGRAHLGAEQGVDAGEAVEGHHRLLDREPGHVGVGERHRVGEGEGVVGAGALRVGLAEREGRQRLAGHDAGGDGGDGAVGGLGDEGDGAGGAGVDLEHVDVAVLDGELDVHQADDAEGERHQLGLALELGDGHLVERPGRERAGAVAGVDAGLLDVLHDAGDVDVVPSEMASTSTSMAFER